MGAGTAAGRGTRNASEWVQERQPEGGRATRRKVAGDGSGRCLEPVQKAVRVEFRNNFANDLEAIPRPRGNRAPNARSRPATTLEALLEQTATRADARLEGSRTRV